MAIIECAFEPCDKEAKKRGYCGTHYARIQRHGDVNYIVYKNPSGNSKHELYRVWSSIKTRCLNPKVNNYHNYGGRGITICNRWLGPDGFENFISDMGPRPSTKHQIDRKDNNGNYEPSNCQWVTRKVNCNNQRRTLKVDGVSLSEWAENNGLTYKQAYQITFRKKIANANHNQ